MNKKAADDKFQESTGINQGKRVLVTGGAGFIGSNLVDRLIKEGHQVSVVDDLSSGKEEYLNHQARFHKIDICSQKLETVFKPDEFDYVFHLAAQIDVRFSVRDPKKDSDINVFGGLNVLDHSLNNGVTKFIFVSTGGAVYGDVPQVPTPETVLPRPVSPYGIHKLSFEKYLNYYYQVHGLDYTVIRPANVFGPRQYKGGETGVISIFIDKTTKKEQCIINGSGEQTRDFVYVDDLVEALIGAMKSDYTGEINIGTGQETSVLEVIEAIERVIGEDVDKKHGPSLPGEQMRSCLSYEKAKKILAWQPKISLEEGIRRTINWTREKGRD